ncbi:MAG: hypothetical protein C4K48_09945 [Candidatus Thorarchaeota archaeon]|nr:MAG: hypothetical protein C4K48_09945 [Candidatus Thorarchaeota archaeon]
MFRIYHCARCNNIGYSQVEREEDLSRCGLCGSLVLHETGSVYAATTQEAKTLARELALESHSSTAVSEGSPPRGLGVKRRVYNIIEAQVDLKRGKPTSLEEVMRECSEAGIELGRAMKFLETLESEGLIVNDGANITVTREVLSDG